MGNICCGDEETAPGKKNPSASAGGMQRRRIVDEDEYGVDGSQHSRARLDTGEELGGHRGDVAFSQPQLPHEASSVASSQAPSPLRMQSQGRADTGNPQQQGTAIGMVGLEPLETGDGGSHSPFATGKTRGGAATDDSPALVLPAAHSSTSSSASPHGSPGGGGAPVKSPASDAADAARFLGFVNGEQSHAVARSLFDTWCVFLGGIQKADEDALLFGGTDGFGGDGGGGVGGRASANYGDASVSTTANTTRVERWATQDATECVSHQSCDEVARQFMRYLKHDLRARSWAGSFDYDIQGYDSTGLLTVRVNTQRPQGDHSLQMVLNYHAVSLL